MKKYIITSFNYEATFQGCTGITSSPDVLCVSEVYPIHFKADESQVTPQGSWQQVSFQTSLGAFMYFILRVCCHFFTCELYKHNLTSVSDSDILSGEELLEKDVN